MCNCISVSEMSRDDKEKIFGVQETSKVNLDGMELRYEAECGQAGEPNYSKVQVMRNEKGNYFVKVKNGPLSGVGCFLPDSLAGREVCFPSTPQALYNWAGMYLAGEDYGRALEEFQCGASVFQYEKIWKYQHDDTYEFLLKTDDGSYMLFSTDSSYPCYGCNQLWTECNEDGSGDCRDDLYLYYITPEVARRWAEFRGMKEDTCQEIFGRCD